MYDTARREEVEKTQHAANVSLAWFEHMKRYFTMAPPQFAFGVMSRSKQITWENLELRDPAFIQGIHQWFARQVKDQGFDIDLQNPPVPMFTPFRLRDMVVENRVVVSPMDQYSAVDGMPTDWHFVHLGSRAIGGAGPGLCRDDLSVARGAHLSRMHRPVERAQRDAFKRIVDFCHANSKAKMCMQLGHSGRKGSTQLGWERMDHPLENGNWPVIAPSPIPYYEGVSQVPREMTRADMDKVLADFVRSTKYADEAGFDMLEIHMAHGYCWRASFRRSRTGARTLTAAQSRTACAFRSRSSRPVARCGRKKTDIGARFGDRLGAGRTVRRGFDGAHPHAQGRGLRSHRLLDGADSAASEARVRAHVPGAVLRLGAQRSRHRDDDGRRGNYAGPGEHAACFRQGGPRGARAPAPRIPISRCRRPPGTGIWASTGRRSISPGATRRIATRRASAPSRSTCASRLGPRATK